MYIDNKCIESWKYKIIFSCKLKMAFNYTEPHENFQLNKVLDEWIDKFNDIFTSEDDKRFIDDNKDLLTKKESERRIFIILVAFIIFLMMCNLFLIAIVLYKINDTKLGTYKVYGEDLPPTHQSLINMYYVHGNPGLLVEMGKKNNVYEKVISI